jgi:hypothetical protein
MQKLSGVSEAARELAMPRFRLIQAASGQKPASTTYVRQLILKHCANNSETLRQLTLEATTKRTKLIGRQRKHHVMRLYIGSNPRQTRILAE